MQPNQPQPLRPDQNNEPSTNPNPVPWNTVPEQPTAAAQPQQPQPAQVPTTLAYTEQEPDTVAHPAARQGYPQQQQAPIQPAQQSTDASEPQPAAIQATQAIPAPKKSRLGLIIASVVTAVLLLGGGATAYVMNQSATKTEEVATTIPATVVPTPQEEILNIDTNNPEEYFYQALENHMKTTYIQQNYSLSVGDTAPMLMDIKGTSDLTDVKTPKSFITYDIQYGGANTSASEMVMFGDSEQYAKITKSMTGASSPKLNQWYRIDALDLSDRQTYDPARLNTIINTPSGILLTGKFDSSIRKELMTYIKENKIYAITTSEDVIIDDKALTRYDLKIDAKKIEALNKKALAAIGTPYDLGANRFEQTPDQINQVWVDQKTGRIAKILLTSATGSGSTMVSGKSSNEIKISYPTKVTTIVKPEGAIAAPKQ